MTEGTVDTLQNYTNMLKVCVLCLRLDPLAVAGHIDVQVKGVVEHFRAEEVVLEVAS